jgi:hypothetical protein
MGMSDVAIAVADNISKVRQRCVRGKEDFDTVFDDLISSGRICGSPEELEAIKIALGQQLRKGRATDPVSRTKPVPRCIAHRFMVREATPTEASVLVDGLEVKFRQVKGRFLKVWKDRQLRLDDVSFRRAHAMATEAILAAQRDSKRPDERRRAQSW